VVNELREITNRNAEGVKATLTSTTGLADRARELGEIMDTMVVGNGNHESQPAKTRRRRASKAATKSSD
jgi:hypothetical protein